jgi:NAD(P)-dependent dehydrogenase (short-subunit alcohol dehydrogenase family)
MSTATHLPERIGRQGTGWEVAHAALFLISNESSYVNTHTLFLDGGHMAGIVRS